MITVLEMGAARHFLRTQQLARTAEERAQILQPTLEINAGCVCVDKLYWVESGRKWVFVLFWLRSAFSQTRSDQEVVRTEGHKLWAGWIITGAGTVLSYFISICPFFPLMISKPKKRHITIFNTFLIFRTKMKCQMCFNEKIKAAL